MFFSALGKASACICFPLKSCSRYTRVAAGSLYLHNNHSHFLNGKRGFKKIAVALSVFPHMRAQDMLESCDISSILWIDS